MTLQVLAGWHGLLRVPVEPGREEARGWAVQELARREYAAQRPSWFQQAVEWLLDRLRDLHLPTGAGSSLTLGVALVVVLALLAFVVRRAGGLRRQARTAGTAGLFDDARPLTPAEHRANADRAAAAGDWRTAVLERFRAVVRELEERTVLVPQAGRTADEAAHAAAAALPDLAGELVAAARAFDDVRYGDRPATEQADARLRALDERVRTARVSLS